MKKEKTLAERWLWLGVSALAVAGVFAIILVVARTPQLAALTVFQKLFSVALVVHVDLSVLMWFIAILGMGTALLAERIGSWNAWPKAAFLTIGAATALMAFSPADTQWEVIKSNYVPVLQNHLFLLSLGLVSAGLLLVVLPTTITMLTRLSLWRQLSHFEQGIAASCITTLLALAAFALSADAMPTGLAPELMYERLFWAGGHILQFSFSLVMMAAWLVLLEKIGVAPLSRRSVAVCYLLMVMGAIVSFAGFSLHPFNTEEFTQHQTRMMIEWGGMGVGLLGIIALAKRLRICVGRENRAYGSTLTMSLIVFASGGFLGILITGQNVTIPAHYHGMIVGITLSFMGLAYAMLPQFGYQSVAATRLAYWQPIVYGVGQLMHIGGLGYSGGYGVLRKTPGEIANIGLNVKIALGIMGTGGTIAIVGGILFVVVMVKALKRPSVSHQTQLI